MIISNEKTKRYRVSTNLIIRTLTSLLMASLIVIGLNAFIIGCAPMAEHNKVDPPNSDDSVDGAGNKIEPDVNGRLTLAVDILKFTEFTDDSQPNGLYVKTLAKVNSVVKEFVFTSTDVNTHYSLNFNQVSGTSCSSNPQGRFYVVGERNTYTPISAFQSFTLLNGTHRLQFRVDNLNCLSVTMRFGLKRF